jgi:branched-chain amino acid transport system ATP-binding protein
MTLLKVSGLSAQYGDLQAISDIDFEVNEGEAIALIGANGAGKSTLLKTLCGLIAPSQGVIEWDGQLITGQAAEQLARAGIALVPEGRMMFASLSVEENLQMGAVTGRKGIWNLASIYELFPILHEKRHQNAMRLSGGQQQMVAIGRALMSNPRLMLCDEISLGLAPAVVSQVYAAFASIRQLAKSQAQGQSLSIVLVEQDVTRAKQECSRLYCLLKGRVTLEGNCAQFDQSTIAKAYFG